MALSKFFLPWAEATLHPFRQLSKKIHEATGRIEAGGDVKIRQARAKESATFRQVGRVPGDKSGFRTKHLGDNKK